MITNGNIFTFGIHTMVLGCNSPNLKGHDCDVVVKSLRYPSPTLDLNSKKRSTFNLETIVAQKRVFLANDLSNQHFEEGAWSSLISEHVGPNMWKYYVLDIVDFLLKLEVHASCRYCNSTSNRTREASIYVKYGALPNERDTTTPLGSAPVTILVPRRGLWYIGVRNFNSTMPLEFDLYWHVESCSYGGSVGDSCASAINSMERVLVEDASESPFNSFYGPSREESLLDSPWFWLSNLTHVGNQTSGNWTYFFVEVPTGASGAVLSVQLRHVVKSTMRVYARWEGFATPEDWDVAQKGHDLSLNLIYPAEGVWCIVVHNVKQLPFGNKTRLEDVPHHGSLVSSRASQLWVYTSHWYHAFVQSLESSWRTVRNGTQETSTFTSALNQSLVELSHPRHDPEVQMHISVHGCVNNCCGRGRCTTSYESSRLHFYSYCHCDAAHGSIDCSVPLLTPKEQSLHLWALIGSNSAALLPSAWALQQKAYSELVLYIASGLASGFYHSCDAGGWCALSYDTLQFLDFWLAFLVIVVTCVSVASLNQDIKGVAHVGTAIITAVIAKEDATSAWNVLVVGLLGLTGLLLGWTLECRRLRLLPSSWLCALGPTRPVVRVESIYYRWEQLLGCIRARFRWWYLIAGLGILVAAGMSWVVETVDTYWRWHSLWHIGIYSAAFLILYSTSKAADAPEASRAGLARSDPEASPMLKDTVELDAFAAVRSRDE